MATTTCGWCDRAVHMTQVRDSFTVQSEYGGSYVSDAAYKCDNCHRLSVVTWWTGYDPSEYFRGGEPESYDRARWNPPPGRWREFLDVPDEIASAATEAWFCHSAGAHRGALAVARAVVEASAKAKGHNGRTLAERIEALKDAGQIRSATKESAHEIRLVGNEIAHGDLAAEIPAEEAEEVLVLMNEILHELFQADARRERIKAAREARKPASK